MDSTFTDQQRFDREVATKGKNVLIGVLAVVTFASLIMSLVALTTDTTPNVGPRTVIVKQANATAAVAAPAPRKVIRLFIDGSWKKGPDGKMHDAFSVTNFHVKVGEPVTLRIDNKDNSPHSITSFAANVNIQAKPGVHDYTLMVSQKGTFSWLCIDPCDSDAAGWAMHQPGYMAGYIYAT